MTLEEVNKIIDKATSQMEQALEHLNHELSKVRTGKASPGLVQEIKVEYYGTPTLLSQVANVSASDAKTIVIQPWEKPMLKVIENALFEANLGITPMNDGEVIRLTIPPMTEDRRKDLVKQAKHLAEEAKISIRNVRRDSMEAIKKMVKDGLAEDMGKRKEDEVQKLTDEHSDKALKYAEAKEKDILTI
ncbi:MAG TPA: ribosome recycling factor [Saprospiraceae bacterium]|nr:ribosome recycling factor [Saprospiraceae bacterium]HQW54988.1 ribosome recycling factor [Saprospiraceae bacterium]